MNEEYEWKKVTKWKDKAEDIIARDTVIIMYGGIIDGIRSKGFEIAFYNGIKDEWFSPANKSIQGYKPSGTIKCEATIEYCED